MKSYKETAERKLEKYGIDMAIQTLQAQIRELEKQKAEYREAIARYPELEAELAGRPWQYAILIEREEEEVGYMYIDYLTVRVLRIPEGVVFDTFDLMEYFHMKNVDVAEEYDFHWLYEPSKKSPGKWTTTERTREEATKLMLKKVEELQKKYPTAKVYDALEPWQYTNVDMPVPAETPEWIRENY